ncbi:MAG TPA: YciI family protein [Fimbriimonadaceae bacterium]|nr:YciI family protein [Fimbriimonadaceae bacterium]
MKVFLCQIRPTKPGFPATGTDDEFAIVGEHFLYLKEATDAGTVLHAGRCDDATFGIVLFTAEGEEAAWSFIRADPAVAAGVFQPEIWEYRIALGAIVAP